MPSRINIGPEDGPYVELNEESGEFVIRVPEDEVNFDQSDLRNVKDFTAGSVSTDSATVTNDVNAGSVSTGDASVGGDGESGNLTVDGSDSDYHWTLIDDTPSVSGDVVTLDGDTSFDQYKLVLLQAGSNEGPVTLTVNGNTTTNYSYFDETGTKLTGETSFLLANHGSNTLRLSGEVNIHTDLFPSFKNLIGEDGNQNMSGYGDKGSLNDVTDVSSVEIRFGTFDQLNKAALYGRVVR